MSVALAPGAPPAWAHTREAAEAAAAVVRARWDRAPAAALILGTGLGGLAARIAVDAEIAYEEIPGFARPTVASHEGRLLCGTLGGKPVSDLPAVTGDLLLS